MDRLFLDANVLFSAAYQADAGLLRLWKLGDVTLCSSHYALEEARINLSDENQKSRLTKLSASLHLFEAGQLPLPRGISLPEKDIPILLAAIASKATHLLTGDVRHFGPYFDRRIAGIAIVRPGDYLRKRARTIYNWT
jgi:predicted nucleic acid-binding protein